MKEKFITTGKNISVCKGVTILGNIFIGNNVIIEGDDIVLSRNIHIGSNVSIYGDNIFIGNDVFIGDNNYINFDINYKHTVILDNEYLKDQEHGLFYKNNNIVTFIGNNGKSYTIDIIKEMKYFVAISISDMFSKMAVRIYVEKLNTLGEDKNEIFNYLKDESVFRKLFIDKEHSLENKPGDYYFIGYNKMIGGCFENARQLKII